MAAPEPKPWRVLGGAEGRAARIDEAGRLAAEGHEPPEIAAEMGVKEWIIRRDLDPPPGAPEDISAQG